MAYTKDVLDRLVPITQFNRGQASRIFDRLNRENQIIVLKNNQPAAIILSPEEYRRLCEMEENYILLEETLGRLMDKNASTSTMEEVMEELNISKEELESAGDVVLE